MEGGSSGAWTVGRVEASLFEAFPRAWAEGWDKVGLSVGDPAAPVSRVALALDATPRAVELAARAGAQALVTHHPAWLEMPGAVSPASSGAPQASATVWEAVRLGVALVAMHTNLDRSPRATGRLPRMLGLEASLLGLEPGRAAGEGGFGSLAPLPGDGWALDELARRCLAAFGRVAQVFGDGGRACRRAAFLTGSAGSLGELALAAGADVVVCGECGYHRALDLAGRGCPVIILGHDASELPLVDVLGERLEEAGLARERLARVDEGPAWHSVAPTA